MRLFFTAVSLHLEDVLKTSDLSMVSQGHSSHTPLSRSTHLTVDTAQQHVRALLYSVLAKLRNGLVFV